LQRGVKAKKDFKRIRFGSNREFKNFLLTAVGNWKGKGGAVYTSLQHSFKRQSLGVDLMRGKGVWISDPTKPCGGTNELPSQKLRKKDFLAHLLSNRRLTLLTKRSKFNSVCERRWNLPRHIPSCQRGEGHQSTSVSPTSTWKTGRRKQWGWTIAITCRMGK